MYSLPEEPDHHDPDTEGWIDDHALASLLAADEPGFERPQSAIVLSAPTELRRVVLKIDGDDDVEVGRVEGRDEAVRLAREWIASIEFAVAGGEWPVIGDRFLRPSAILSVDVQRAD